MIEVFTFFPLSDYINLLYMLSIIIFPIKDIKNVPMIVINPR